MNAVGYILRDSATLPLANKVTVPLLIPPTREEHHLRVRNITYASGAPCEEIHI